MNPYSSTLAFAKVRLLAGGSRGRLLVLPPPVAFPSFPVIHAWRLLPSQRLEGSRFTVRPELNLYSSHLEFARVRYVGRRLPRTSPGVATSRSVSVGSADPTPSRYSRVETFPGAACYTTLDRATIFWRDHASGRSTVKSGSPPGAGPVTPSICHLSFLYFLCRGSKASRNPSPRKFSASKVLPIAIAGKTSNHQ